VSAAAAEEPASHSGVPFADASPGEVRAAFLARLPGCEGCFVANAQGRFQADLYGLARCVLEGAGVAEVHGGGWCTHQDADRFFSFRRDGVTGRQATLAWLG
jgi:copper oxidase (laccase) domain-containing protein